MSGRLRTVLVGLALPLRLYLGGVFIAACLYKIAQPGQFALSIATYDILPLGLINLMAITLPWIELLVGICLIAGYWTRASALAVSGMMVLFLVALAIALARDLHMSCGCFASTEAGDEINVGTLVRDGLWLAGGLYLVVVDDGRFGIDGWLRRRRARAHGGDATH